jgi:hypothetical protein
MFILVYFQGRPPHMVYFHGRPALPLTLIYFHGRPTHTCSSWSIFKGDRPTHSHGLFSWATCPHFILVYFQGRPAHTLTLVYFQVAQGRPAHTSSWSIFRGDLPTHVHRGLFLGVTSPHTHTGLFSGATGPHLFIVVYFQGRPAYTLTLVYFQGRPAHTCSSWSIFRGDRPTHSHGLFSWATCPHTHIGFFF